MITLKHEIKQDHNGFFAEISVDCNDELQNIKIIKDNHSFYCNKIKTEPRKNLCETLDDLRKVVLETKEFCEKTIKTLSIIDTINYDEIIK